MKIAPVASVLALTLFACGSNDAPPPAAPNAPPAAPPTAPAATPPASDAQPALRLPSDVRPTSQSVTLTVDPNQPRFSGVTDIAVTIDAPRATIWMHGEGLAVKKATVKTSDGAELAGTWAQKDPNGLASLTLPRAIAGAATIHFEYDAPFNTSLEGLHTLKEAGLTYAVTQFESTSARLAFPCFDEPGFKIPWDETLVVPKGATAIGNTRETARADEGAWTRVTFARTVPLPSYLVAFAVGPWEIVNAPDVPPNAVRKRPLPLRGIVAKGRAKDMQYALAHTGEFVTLLEKYFGLEYAFDKLDMIACPDKPGAMENPGAVTFDESLLLFDPKTAPVSQMRGYAGVVAHELAHQWVGDLVTAAWWDDIWLNEAFATWTAAKIVDQWNPKLEGGIQLLESEQGAMGTDSLASARSIRQPIASPHDIGNAFDDITYRKGGSVLAMFERWIGPDTFAKGVHQYLASRSFKNATADDFLDALSAAAGKDVKTPFHTFLDQPGVPFVEAQVACDGKPRLHVKQSRYLPLGSTADANKTWSIPICARSATGKSAAESCALVTGVEGDVPLGASCPDWVFPNADAAGYFRFALSAPDLAKLRTKGLPALSEREKIAYGNSLRAAYNRNASPFADVMKAAEALAKDPLPEVADEPRGLVGQAHDWLWGDPLEKNVEGYGRKVYGAIGASLGWKARATDTDDQRRMRRSVLDFLAFTAHDPAAVAEAKKRALAYLGMGPKGDGAVHTDALEADLAGVALAALGHDADAKTWDALRARLPSIEDELLRKRVIAALGSAASPELSPRALDLSLDPALPVTEVLTPIAIQLEQPETRDAAWRWYQAHFDALVGRLGEHMFREYVIRIAEVFCDDDHAKEVEAFLTPRAASIEGGPRALASTVEDIRLCAAKRKAQEPSARQFFTKNK